ncbi:hypothetical protein BMS3Abin16_01365 [archaeon BMS3Abin16]|nr:hypothetical protein BMS3Abin16_01365 [archaeon BMS3Abin16]HDY74557.1 hypothetical protein [Euryarchaeota archaeon]
MNDITPYMPLVYVVIGGLITAVPSYFIQRMIFNHNFELKKMELENEKKRIMFEKIRLEKIEAYRIILSTFVKMKWQIERAYNVRNAYDKLEKSIEDGNRLSNDDLIMIIETLPPDIKQRLYSDFTPRTDDQLLKLIKLVYDGERIQVERIHEESMDKLSIYKLFVDTDIMDKMADIEEEMLSLDLRMNYDEYQKWKKSYQNKMSAITKIVKKELTNI